MTPIRWRVLLCFVALLTTPSVDALAVDDPAADAPNVRAELRKQSAWTGEPVPLVVTLYSPGPFSGAAAFDLPRLSRTTIVTTGSPLVGSDGAPIRRWRRLTGVVKL